MKQISVWGINGSPQRKGLCVRLLKRVLKECRRQGARVRLIHLIDHENELFRLAHRKHPPTKIRRLLDKIKKEEPNCLVMATPVHWFGVSTLMKCFIDHLSYLEYDHRPRPNNYALEGTVVSFIATANEDGGLKAVLDMAGPLNQMGAIIPPYATYFYNRKMAKKSEDRWMLNDPELLGRNVVRTAELTKNALDWE